MKKNKKVLYTIFIIGFVLLYLCTALISFFHATEFFAIGNAPWMSVTLAAVFELGQMIVLSSLLLSDNKKTLIPWILLVVLTAVQVVGNVFSVYKFIAMSGSSDYVYLQKPLIDWWLTGVKQETIVVIISWITGALLPIIALFMTSMVANNIQLMRGGGIEDEQEKLDLSDSVEKEDKVIENNEKVAEIEEKGPNIEIEAPKREIKYEKGSADSLREMYGVKE